MPTSSAGVEAHAVPTFHSAQESGIPVGAVTFIVPEASGTVRNLPELGIFEGGTCWLRHAVPLSQVGDLLRDANPDNDRAACGQLRIFISEVETMEQDRQLSSVQAFDLNELAQNIRTSLGCPDRRPGRGRHGGPAGPATR